ncbi:MAG: DUF1273 family protein [Clostridia bacterium]|nr:DUF1273 family protein [Clostridia bacterium]
MEDNKRITACFSGHRKIPQEDVPMVVKGIIDVVIECIKKGYKYFLNGGALGFDTYAAVALLNLKQKYHDIKLILVLPCPEQTKLWNDKDIKLYERIKKEADKVIYTSDHYFKGCMHKRNRYLVDHSSLCISYLKKDTGGTAYTVNYALRSGIEVINIFKRES